MMSSNSTNEEEPMVLMLCDDNKDYKETCDDEVNDMVPRLERLCINDNPMNLPSNNMGILSFSKDTVKSSIQSSEETSKADLKENVSGVFVGKISNNIRLREVTKVVAGNKIFLSGSEKPSPVISSNAPVDIQPQEFFQKAAASPEINMRLVDPKEQMLGKHIEPKEIGTEGVDENPLNHSSKRSLDHNEHKPSSPISEDKTDLQPLTVTLEKRKCIDPETGEVTENSNILSESPVCGSDNIGKDLDHFADEMSSGIKFAVDSSKLSYSADESSDDQSRSSRGNVPDSPTDTPDVSVRNAASTEYKRTRKTAVFVPPVLGTSEIRQRRFSTFQPPSGIIDAKGLSKRNSSSDEGSKKATAIGKNTPINYRRKFRKTVKISPRPKPPNSLDVEKDEKKRPSPCKRKKASSENSAQATGKIRKRSLSEHNSETREKSHLFIRSRSFSPDSKNCRTTSIINIPSKIPIPLSRKRASSDCQNLSRIKHHRSSNSSDAESK